MSHRPESRYRPTALWRSIGERRRWALVVAAAALALAALNIWWVATYRHGYPFDIDEAGYTSFAWIEYTGLKNGGLHDWWNAVLNQAPFAPLLPALTSLVFVFKAGLLEGFGVLTAFLVLLTLAVYGIGERLAGPRLGAVAALVAATLPGAFAFSREYVFALPTAALLASAVYCMLRSDGLRARRWAIACGVMLGLMLLARTMSIAFVPGVLLAAVVCMVARRQEDVWVRFLNLGLMVLTGAAIASIWWARNLHSIFDYLTNYGYGTQSQYYSTSHSLFSWERLHAVYLRMSTEDLLAPLAALSLVGLIVVLAGVVSRVVQSPDRGAVMKRMIATDAFSLAIVVAAGYAALTSSRNGGDGFTFPISALIPVLAVLALRFFPRAARPTVAIVALVVCVNVVSNLNVWTAASEARTISVPGFGTVPYTSGVPHAVFSIRKQVPGPETRFDDSDKGWPVADSAVAAQLVEWQGPYGEMPVTVFAMRNRVINPNTVQLATVMAYGTGVPIAQLVAEPDDSIANYRKQLTETEFGSPSVLITTSRNTRDYPPKVTQSHAEAAARQLGFRKVRSLPLPDGRILRIWHRPSA